jgi:hypothetical protein
MTTNKKAEQVATRPASNTAFNEADYTASIVSQLERLVIAVMQNRLAIDRQAERQACAIDRQTDALTSIAVAIEVQTAIHKDYASGSLSPVIEMVGCWMTTSFENMDSAIERLGDVVAVAINGVCDAVDDTCSVIEKVGSKAAAKPVRKTKTAVPK